MYFSFPSFHLMMTEAVLCNRPATCRSGEENSRLSPQHLRQARVADESQQQPRYGTREASLAPTKG